MADNYDGSIRIDTRINTQPIDAGVSQIEDKIKGLASTVGLAFGMKELVEFGSKAINAASDLAEAQNVVDTAFGSMSYKMEQFAATALDTYGISELTAKNMGSTYMAMAKGMGVAEGAASDMAVTLTGRLSDIMSFYNKSQTEVDTIGRSLITGETEPLKAIGVVMTQTNLQAYAMAQGLNKAYNEMSAQEQLLVRYKYFLEQTAMAEGDFADTSEGWANQTRLLSERLNQFITNFGQLLINAFTPVLQFANEAVSFLNDLFFGGNEEDSTAVKNAEAVADEVSAVGTEADKSKKKLNNLLSGFDELHIISSSKSKSSETIDAGIDTSDLLGVSLEKDTASAKKSAKKYRDILNQIYLAFKQHPLTKIIENILDDLGDFFGFIDEKGNIDAGAIVTTLEDILTAFLAYKAVTGVISGIGAFQTGFSSLIGIITANPVAAAIVGLTALGIAIYDLTLELKKQNIADCFGDISISFEEIAELTDPISGGMDKIADAFADNKTKLENAKDNFKEIATAVQETIDAFKGGENDSSVEDFAQQLDGFIDAALGVNDAVTDTSALEALYASDGVISEAEQKSLDLIAGIGDSVAGKIETIRAQIHTITQTAIDENRSLLESELQNIQDLYDEIARMTTMQEDIKTTATWERLKSGAYTYNSYAELADAIKEAQQQAEKSRDEVKQSSYENVISAITYGLNNGTMTEEEAERYKKDQFALIDESLKAKELESKKYERDVITAWAQGAMVNMSKYYYGTDPDGQKKMQQYFDLLLSTPDGVDIESLALQLGESNYYRNAFSALQELSGMTGFDFQEEWTRLNKECGDNGKRGGEEFYSKFAEVIENSDIRAEDILPKVEDIKRLGEDSEEAYVAAVTGWIENTDFLMTIGTSVDSTEADAWLTDYKKKLGDLSISPTVYAQQPPSALPYGNNEIAIKLFFEGENVETASQSVLFEGTGREKLFNIPVTVNNGKGR